MEKSRDERLYDELSKMDIQDVEKVKDMFFKKHPNLSDNPTIAYVFIRVIDEKKTAAAQQEIFDMIREVKSAPDSATNTVTGQ